MFNTASKKIAAVALAVAALATVALPMAEAEARSRRGDAALFGAALVGGTLLGAALTSPSRRHHVVYEDEYVPVRRCWNKRRFVGYNEWDEPVYRRVRVCSR